MCLPNTRRCWIATMCMLSPLLCASQQTPGNFISFQVPGAAWTLPMSVNDSMVVTGYYLESGGYPRGFLRNADGDITTFVVSGSSLTSPVAINAAGEIAGNSVTGSDFYGFVRYANGSIATFNPGGTYPGYTDVAGINKEGIVVGGYAPTNGVPPEHGFIRNLNGTITTFDVPGSDRTQPVAINNAGEITGVYWFDGNVHEGGFIRSADGNITTFGGTPVGINAEGSIVGWSILEGGSKEGFERNPYGTIKPLDLKLAYGAPPNMGITEAGSIFTSSSVQGAQGTGVFLEPPYGTSISLLFPGSYNTLGTSINDSDVITGTYYLYTYVNPGNHIAVQCICGFLWMPEVDNH